METPGDALGSALPSWAYFPARAPPECLVAFAAKQTVCIIAGMGKPIDPDRRKQLQERLLEHLEAAQAITDELDDGPTGYLVERALDEARSTVWPHTDPNFELFRKGKG